MAGVGIEVRHGGGGGAGGAPSGPAGGDLTGTYPNPTIGANKTTNAKLATMATQTIKGRTTAGTGNVEDLTAAQATAILDAMVGDSGSGGTKGLVPAPASGDAAALKYLKADGTWATVSKGNSFTIVQPDSGTSPTADSDADTLTLTSTDLSVTGDSTTDTITLDLKSQHKLVTIDVGISGNGQAIATGIAPTALRVPFAMTVTGWHLVADQSGSIVIDVWKDTYANFPPTVADTIAGTEKPTLSSVQKNEDTSLSTWTTSLAAGDWLYFNVDSVTTCTWVKLVIMGTRT